MFCTEKASLAASQLFGVTGSVSRLPGEHDANFQLKSDCGKTYLLKISCPEQNPTLALQTDILLWLQQQHQAFAFPRLQASLSGEWVGQYDEKDKTHFVRLFDFIPGKLLGDCKPHSADLLANLGQQLGHLTLALKNFQHAAASHYIKWDLKHACWIKEHLTAIENPANCNMVEKFISQFELNVLPVWPALRQSIIHGDMNDYNILVSDDKNKIAGFIDFGDVVETVTISELAIALTYAMMDKTNPIDTAAQIIRHYHAVYPLEKNEIGILYYLIAMRLCVSVVNSALRKKVDPGNAYLTISERPAWELLKQLHLLQPDNVSEIFHHACCR